MTADTARRVRRALDGDAYSIGLDGETGKWWARRRNGQGALLEVETPDELRQFLGGSDSPVVTSRAFTVTGLRVLERSEGGDGRTVEAYAAVFSTPAEIVDQDGHYMEQIAPGAFDTSIAQRAAQIFCVYNHAKTLGGTPSDRWSVPLGTPVSIRCDTRGLLTQVRYNTDPESERILQAIISGSLKGMSFTGVFLRSDPELTSPWASYGPDKDGKLPLVTRTEIALIEFGPTPIPAYETAQVIGVRARLESGRENGQPLALTPQMAHLAVGATPVHHTGIADPAEVQWDWQQMRNNAAFPLTEDQMASLYSMYDTSSRFADGTYPASAGHQMHHVISADGTVGHAHPVAVQQALDELDSLPASSETKVRAREHLQAHMADTPAELRKAASQIDQTPTSQADGTGATNGQGVPAAKVPTASAGRQDDAGEHDRTDAEQAREHARQLREQAAAAEEYARAVAELAQAPAARGGDAPGNGSLPYGHTTYADPGYLDADGKPAKDGNGVKRYPVDAKHVTAAWSYINQDKNASQYTAEQLASIKAKIVAAMKEHGHDVQDEPDADDKNGSGGSDDDADVKKSKSSSGRQPGAESAAERTDPGTGPQDGTGTQNAEPHQHPARNETPAEADMTLAPMNMEARRARLEEVQGRLAALHTAYPDDMPEAARTEWDKLVSERDTHNAALEDAASRAAMIASFSSPAAAAAGATEGAGNAAGFAQGGAAEGGAGAAPGVRGAPQFKPTQDRADLYDIQAVLGRVRSLADLPVAFRDQAMRCVDVARFPDIRSTRDNSLVKVTREDAQETIERLLHTVDVDGVLAQRIMATGDPVYDRAFGKVITAKTPNMIALAPEESRALALGVDTAGGYAVPFQLDPTVILTSNGAINPLRQIARVETITGKEWDGVTSAGVTVSRVAEGTEAGTGDAAFVQPTVRTTRVQGFVPFNIELDVSWGALRSQMTALLMDAKDIEEASSFLLGNGTAPQANGLVGTMGTAQAVLTAGTAALAIDDLYSLENAMPPRFRQQSMYLASRTTYNRFRRLFQALASAAFDSWVRPSAGQPATFNGYPAFEQSNMSNLLTSGSQVLLQGDYKQFLIVDRIGMGIELIPHLFGPTNRYPVGQRGILAIWFNNSRILNPNAFRLLTTL